MNSDLKEITNEVLLFFKLLNSTLKRFNNIPSGEYLDKHDVMRLLRCCERTLSDKRLSIAKQQEIKDGKMKLDHDLSYYLLEGEHYFNNGQFLYKKSKIVDAIENSNAILKP